MKKITMIEISSEDLETFLVSKGLILPKEKISDYAFLANKRGISVSVENPVNDYPSDQRVLLETKLEDFDLTVRTFNLLKAMRINTFGEILHNSLEKYRLTRNWGRKSLTEIDEFVKGKGFQLPE